MMTKPKPPNQPFVYVVDDEETVPLDVLDVRIPCRRRTLDVRLSALRHPLAAFRDGLAVASP